MVQATHILSFFFCIQISMNVLIIADVIPMLYVAIRKAAIPAGVKVAIMEMELHVKV